jgi:aspartokinase
MDKIKIQGIKQSGELVAVSFIKCSEIMMSVERFFQVISDEQINLTYLTASNRYHDERVTFCVDVEKLYSVHHWIKKEKDLIAHAYFVESVVLLSIFNHSFSLDILAHVLNAFGEKNILFYGSASSLSSLSFIIRYNQRHEAISAIQEYMDVSLDQIYSSPIENY